MSGFATMTVQAWIDDIEAQEKWATGFSQDPHGVADPLAVEIVGGGLARQTTTWTRTGPNTLTLAAPIKLAGLAPGTVLAAIGFFDAAANGNFLAADLFRDAVGSPSPIVYPSGGTYVLPAGEYVLGIDV